MTSNVDADDSMDFFEGVFSLPSLSTHPPPPPHEPPKPPPRKRAKRESVSLSFDSLPTNPTTSASNVSSFAEFPFTPSGSCPPDSVSGAKVPSMEPLPPVPHLPPPPLTNDTDDYHGNMMSKLVTTKDLVTEDFLREIIDSLPQRNDLSATELSRLWKDEARKRITNYSVTLSHKLAPLIQIMLDQKLATTMETTFVEVDTNKPDLLDMVKRYERCFNTWIDDSDCVTFKAHNTRLLGKVSAKDMYILTFFTFCTCRRTKNDNVLQLGLVGCSTSGKSTLFEACLLEGSHVTTNEQGVGRFQVGNKPVLLFHDIAIRTLALSKDTEKIKTIARTEPTVTKIHSSTYTLQPLFLFYSSNERLMTHKFTNCLPGESFRWQLYHGQVNELSTHGRKKATEENLSALQNRFIEAFVRKPPKLNRQDLPQSGSFQRLHGILGMYSRILDIMTKYDPSDFYSPVLRQYVMHGLCSNYKHYMDVHPVADLNARLRVLVNKHIDLSLQHSLLKAL